MRRSIILLAPLLFASTACNPSGSGQSAANEDPVSDNHIVLVRQGKIIGAFIPYDQTSSPENTSFTWYARSDGKGNFPASDPLVSTGSGIDQTNIRFSVFSIDWSINMDGKGWVYFSKLPTDTKTTAAYEMCVTTETDITRIDANDSKWKFRESPPLDIKALLEP